jgi:hypothetical protein
MVLRTNLEAVANGAVNFLNLNAVFSVGKGAINAPGYWELHNDAFSV